MTTFLTFTLFGFAVAAVYAIAASGLVLTYTTSGIFNFAHGAIGMLMAFTYWQLRVHSHLPAPIALLLVLGIIAPLLGAAIERILMRDLGGATTGTTLVVTCGLLILLIGVAYVLWSPTKSRTLPEFYAGQFVTVLHVRISWHKIITFILAGVVALGLRVVLYRTRMGIAMRAVVDDRDLTALNGARPARVSQLSWALSASLAGLAGILIAPQVQLNVINLTFLVVSAYAAAMVGRLKSLPLTFLGALILGLADQYAVAYLTKYKTLQNVRPAMPTILLFLVLIVLPANRLRVGRVVGTRTPRVPSGREAMAYSAGFVALAAIVANIVGGTNLRALNTGLVIGLVMLSLVLLTGYGGQVALGQFTFVGIGAFVFGRFASGGSPFGLVLCVLVCAAVGALFALPALRLQGLYLALSTLAFAILADQLFFGDSHVLGQSGGSLKVHRLAVPGLSVSSYRANLVLLAVAFAAVGMAVLAIRRGPFGRTLAAMSDSPAACATLGLDLTFTKLAAFALSAGMAGLAGALFGGTQGLVTATNFVYIQSLVLLLLAYVGGINTVTGAFIGGMLLGAVFPIVQPHLPHSLQQLTFLGTGLGALTVARSPNGIAGQLTDAVERLRRPRPTDLGRASDRATVREGEPVAAAVG
ncbi:MAG: hypothetical protein NVSMB12_09750 [Acidimicrobiales bacterium]